MSTIALALLLASIAASSQSKPASISPTGEALPASPPATVKVYTIDSRRLGQTRRIFIATPPSFEQTTPARLYPTAIVLDGEGASARAFVSAAAELADHGLIPEIIVVGIENTDPFRGRINDLTPPGLSVSGSSMTEGGDRFLDFLEQELLPALDAQFRTGAPRLLSGHSSGGVLATYAAATRPTFRFVVSLDAPIYLGNNWLASRLIERAANNPGQLRYVSVGASSGWSAAAWQKLKEAAPAAWNLQSESVANETHVSMPWLGSYLALKAIFADYSRLAAPEFPTTRILPYYEALEPGYGARVHAPEPVLRDVINDLLGEGRGLEAKAALEQLIAGYGEPSNVTQLRTQIDDVMQRPRPTETVESLLAMPLPTPRDAAPYIGTWEGENWMEGGNGQRNRFTLTIEDIDGHIVATTMRNSPDGIRTEKVPYFQVGPDEFTYGFMNGMRPRGLLLYTMHKQGDRFVGQMRWGGISAPMPGGRPHPIVHVEMRQVPPRVLVR